MTDREEGKGRSDEIREATRAYQATRRTPVRDSPALEEIVARVVEIANPDRIILFGSAARGEAGPDSDIDLLVISSNIESRIGLEGKIYRNLIGIDHDIDVVVLTPDDVERLSSGVGSVVPAAVREGREIYVAPEA